MMHGTAVAGGVLAEPGKVGGAVLFTEEACRFQATALDHMQRVAEISG